MHNYNYGVIGNFRKGNSYFALIEIAYILNVYQPIDHVPGAAYDLLPS